MKGLTGAVCVVLSSDVCELTLDPNTAQKSLSLSENCRKVTNAGKDQGYPAHPDRFDVLEQVLCRQILTGRCYWEVEWSDRVNVSVAYGGLARFGYNDKSWSLFCCDGGYSAIHNGMQTKLPARPSSGLRLRNSNRVAVYVDRPAGTVSFYKVSSKLTHLHTFQTTFTEALYAGLGCWYTAGSSASLCQI